MFFLRPYRLTIFLVFGQATDQKSIFSYHIFMNILNINCYFRKSQENSSVEVTF